MKNKYRQGDVILIPIDKVPERAKELSHRVVAEGEATGHAHRLEAGALFSFDDKMYACLQDELTTLSHEEHREIKLPAGNYEIIIQREGDDTDEWTKVID